MRVEKRLLCRKHFQIGGCAVLHKVVVVFNGFRQIVNLVDEQSAALLVLVVAHQSVAHFSSGGKHCVLKRVERLLLLQFGCLQRGDVASAAEEWRR